MTPFRPHPKPEPKPKVRKVSSFASTKRKPLRARSKKMEAKYAGTDDTEGRRAFVARILTERPTCEAGAVIGAHILGVDPVGYASTAVFLRAAAGCQTASVDVHEILARSACGDILDPDNVKACCRHCHEWIGDHPKDALKLGLRKSRYPGRNR